VTPDTTSPAWSGRQAVVVAHPDDEALWFTSVLREVDRIIICFRDAVSMPGCSAGRQRVLQEFPLKSVVCLEITESESFEAADWLAPQETDVGLQVHYHDRVMAGFSVRGYRENFARLRNALAPLLEGMQVVYTHNPWGEYGHEDHVQVFRAVESLRKTGGFDLRFGLCASEKSAALMARYLPRLPDPIVRRPTDRALGEELRQIYVKHGAWTWYRNNEWPEEEAFVSWSGDPAPARSHGSFVPIRMVHIDWGFQKIRPIGSAERLARRVLARLRLLR
jgi:LmbE family N-acetylglucosaminyl deacetylase